MKKIVFILFFWVVATVLPAQTLTLQKGWQLVGASNDINLTQDFNDSCIDIVWSFDNKYKSWGAYSPKSAIVKILGNIKGIHHIDTIKKGLGFWLKASTNCTLTLYPEGLSDDTNATRAQAITFLKQAAIALRESDIEYVMRHGYAAWIERQLNLPFDENRSMLNLLYTTLHRLDATRYTPQMAHPQDVARCDKTPTPMKYRLIANSLWWKRVFEDSDQLRQKVAYALSQIIVVSANSPAGNLLGWRGEGLAYYYDILQKRAFGNYKDLLRDITYSPAMAYYMTYIGSAKYDPKKGTSPDENYARELMQLFSIGTSKLNIDGTVQRVNGRDIPTYTQKDVMNNAKIFTGWDAHSKRFGATGTYSGCYLLPIAFHQAYHDYSAKEVLGHTIPAGQSGKEDIESILTILMNNNNMAPYICKKLIQRMTTSNPSAGYVKRVASVFNDNGHGVKGDLKAVVKAILLDKEARSDANPYRARMDELLTSLAHLFSTFNAKPMYGWSLYGNQVSKTNPLYWIYTGGVFDQAVMGAPDVFNFYDANYAPNDPAFVSKKLIAPELQLHTSRNLIRYANFLQKVFTKYEKFSILHIDKRYTNMDDFITNELQGKSHSSQIWTYFDLSDVYETFQKALGTDASFANLKNHPQELKRGITTLVEYLDNKMLGKRLPDDYKKVLIQELQKVGGYDKKLPKRARNIVVSAIIAIATSPYYMIIR